MSSDTNMNTARRLVVTGATGKQGGGLISALLEKPNHPFEIYAVTRDPASKGSEALSRQGVKVIKGDFDNAPAIFSQVDKPWGLFSVTMPLKGAKLEEQQGKAMTKAAVDAGVQHIVFTATERGGQERSETNQTDIPHFISKFNIEKDILDKAKASAQATTWTFLRPVAFYENLAPGFFGKGFISMWRLNGMDRKLQMISTKDIGKVAAEAFIKADSAEYKNQAISLAGDDISPNEAARIFKETTGQEIPTTYPFVGRALRYFLKEQLGTMFDWFVTDGFHTDIGAVKQRYPYLKDFRAWLETESAWAKK